MIKLDKRNPQPLYLQFKEGLRAQISSGKLKPGMPVLDERSWADEIGLSRMTVRRALVELTEEGFFERIPGRGTFVKQSTPALNGDGAAAQRQIGTIAVVGHFDALEVRHSLFYYRIIQGLMQTLNPADAIVFRKVARPADSFVKTVEADRAIKAAVILGVVDAQLLNALGKLQLPMVLVDSAQPDTRKLDRVDHEGEESCVAAVSHLIGMGHRDIGIMNFQGTPVARQRHKCYVQALEARGLKANPEFSYIVDCSSTAAYSAARRLLKSRHAPSGIFCTTDDIAVGVISAAKDECLKVPEQLSVVGYGDLGYFCTPSLTTVRIPAEQMGALAARLLSERSCNAELPPRNATVPTEFIARASCDAAQS
jgi:DNA-binding LacI/PurR family transcriptional regulator